VKGDEARERIQKLLVTGDNRLKQGVDPAKVRQAEQALRRRARLASRRIAHSWVELADLERSGDLPTFSMTPDVAFLGRCPCGAMGHGSAAALQRLD
jgi:hypothetical protein